MIRNFLCFFLCVFLTSLTGEDLVWTPPALISSGNSDACDARVAMDSKGNVVAIWIENGILYARNQPINQSWQSIIPISSAGASSPNLVMDTNSNATAIWIQTGVVQVSTLAFGGSWTTPITLSSIGASSPVIAVDPAGNLAAAWVRNGYIEAAIQQVSKAWSTPELISNTGADDSPNIAFNGSPASNAALVWHAVQNGQDNIFISQNSSLNNALWLAPVNISDLLHNNVMPKVAVDLNQNVIVTWFRYDVKNGGDTNVVPQAILLPFNRPSGAVVDIASEFGNMSPERLSNTIAFDDDGNAIVVWSNSFDGATYSVAGAVLPTNCTWQPLPCVVGLNRFAQFVDISFNPVGDAYLVLMSDGDLVDIRAVDIDVRLSMPNEWHTAQVISTGSVNAFPKIVSSASGGQIYAQAIWINFDGKNTQVSASFGTQSVFQPPTNLTVVQSSQDFHAFTEWFNTLSWTPSLSQGVFGYIVFRNDKVIQYVDAQTTQIVDHNRGLNEPVVYKVVAYDQAFNQSHFAIVSFP